MPLFLLSNWNEFVVDKLGQRKTSLKTLYQMYEWKGKLSIVKAVRSHLNVQIEHKITFLHCRKTVSNRILSKNLHSCQKQ